MPERWGPVAGEVGLGANASAIEVAALHGMVLAPGASSAVELRGRVLCYPEETSEAILRLVVTEWVLAPPARDPADSQVSLRF